MAASFLVSVEPFSSIILSRIDTFQSINTDVSFLSRSSGYNVILNTALREFLGIGIGFTLNTFETELGSNDITILPMLLSFGWFGMLFYFSGIMLILVELFWKKTIYFDEFSGSTIAVVIGILSQAGLNYIFIESMGMIFWLFLGISLSAKKYYYFYQQYIY